MLLHRLFTFLLILPLSVFFGCNSEGIPTPPVNNNGTLAISPIETSCTETWIELKTVNVALPINVNVLANNNPVAQLNNLHSSDTTVYIDSLLPNKSYQINVQFIKDKQTISSNKLTVQTLDTTSNNFTWQTYTFGDGASSVLRGVTIISPDNIFAVGQIYINDSTGQPDPLPYCLVHWNGSNWKVLKLKFFPPGSIGDSISVIGSAIFAFGANDIWMTGGAVFHYDGNKWNPYYGTAGAEGATKIWGYDSGNLWFIGRNGLIVHYQNGQWSKIESGTSLGFVDIWGDTNPFTGNTEILCGAYNQIPSQQSDLIRINNDNTTDKVDRTGLGEGGEIWFKSGIRYYLVGDGLFEKRFKANSWINLNQNKTITQYFMDCVRGSDLNDIYVAGAYGEFLHFNGSNWKSFINYTYLDSGGAYYSLVVKGNLVVAVGFNQSKAVILVGQHQ